MSPSADEELLRRIAERDFEAFELLYRRYARAVYSLALDRLRDREDAESAIRRAFAALWSTASSFGGERGDAAFWVFTVARRAIDGPATETSTADEGWDAFLVHVSVAELPEPERAPLELAYWGGRGPGEIAELLGLPVDAVAARTRAALERLAARLDGLP